MIVTEFYNGQGLGNQLWCYATTRVIATDRGYDFGIMSPEKLKALDFMNLDFGRPVTGGNGPEGGPPTSLPDGIKFYYNERRIDHPATGVDIRTYDPRLVKVPDNTKIDGIMQDEQYIAHRKDEIRVWLKVRPELACLGYASDDICVINFRGGEYTRIAAVFLPQTYWDTAITHMRRINPKFRFVVITDDVPTAKKFFPSFDVFHFNITKDYSIINNAHFLILSNSSFAWFPAWLNKRLKFCIAPKYWSQYNRSDGYWGCTFNLTKGWQYLNREGQLQDYEVCRQELDSYIKSHRSYFDQPRIKDNFLVISNYHNDLSWVPAYTDRYLVYDRSKQGIYPPELDRTKIIKQPNVGYNLYDYFTYIIDNYDDLPAVVIFVKGNVFPRHVTEAEWNRLMNNRYFTPIEDWRMHLEQWPVSFFSSDGGFCEINNNWYLQYHPTKYFATYNDFLSFCFADSVIPRYIRFAPGANYVVPKENIQKYSKVFYENLRTFVSHGQLSGESHIIERALHTIWGGSYEPSPAMLSPIPANMKRVDLFPRRRPTLPGRALRLASWLKSKLV